MKPATFPSSLPSFTLQTFDCHEGLGLTIQEGGHDKSVRLAMSTALEAVRDIGQRIRNKVSADDLEAVGTFYIALARERRSYAA